MNAMHTQPETQHAPPVRRCACGGMVGPSGECAACRAKRLAKEALSRGTGKTLDAATRSSMERSFRQDFSKVRIHTDEGATRSLGARAFTVGANVVMGSGGYSPRQTGATSVLAHELAHVVQQRNHLGPEIGSRATPLAEAEARSAAVAATQGRSVGAMSSQPLAVARQDLDAGVPSDAGTTGGTDAAGMSRQPEQVQCVIRLGGCPQSRPAGIPSSEEIAGYNAECRRETSYTGPDVTPSDQECSGAVAPGTSPGTAMICSKRLEAPVLGWFFNHAYIDDTGRGDCRGASMLNNYAVQTLVSGSFINGCAVKTDTSTDPQTYTPNMKRCDPAPGVTDVHKCLRAAFTAYNDPSEYSNDPRRSPWGPNSNTFAATLARACCADSTSRGLGSVPGWDHSPAPPCPTSTGGAASTEGAPREEVAV
jgi:hypothetical protein